MNRREFIALVGGAAVAWPLGVQAQQVRKKYRMAYVTVASRLDSDAYNQVMLQELSQLGYVEGQNFQVERYSTEGNSERRTEVAQAAVRSKPDVIFVLTGPLTQHVRDASATVPIVSGTADPIAFGLTTSLAHPSGNVTGLVVDTGIDIYGKRLELLKEVAPTASRIGFLTRKAVWEGTEIPAVMRALRSAAEKAGVNLTGVPIESPIQEATYRRAIELISKARVDALIVQDSMENLAHHKLIVELIEKARIPAIYPYPDFAKAGGLITFTADLFELYRHGARQIDQIFRGIPVQDIPFYQSKSFRLILNAKSASELGIRFPASLLARADEVIE